MGHRAVLSIASGCLVFLLTLFRGCRCDGLTIPVATVAKPCEVRGCSVDSGHPAMTHQSHAPRYFERLSHPFGLVAPGRLADVRVRMLELRLIAVALIACWTLTAGLLLVVYRPGGPVAIAVGLVVVVRPIGISLAGL